MKPSSLKRFFFLACMLWALAGCNSAPQSSSPSAATDGAATEDTVTAVTPADTAATVAADSAAPQEEISYGTAPHAGSDTAVHIKHMHRPQAMPHEAPQAMPPDSIAAAPDTVVNPADATKASLAYKYPATITQNQVKDVWVYVKVHVSRTAAKAKLKQAIEDYEHNVEKDDTINIYTTDIDLYDNLTITLQDPAKDFTITALHTADKQVIDTVRGNEWHWTIETKSDKKEAMLVINAMTDNADGKPATVVNTKKIEIRIKLENTWLRRWYDWLLHNPEYVICTLLVPFIIFLYKKFSGKKKDEEGGKS